MKLRHQDIRYEVVYQQGKLNQSDYLSRHAKPIEKMSSAIQDEANDLTNLLYTLHATPIMDHIGIGAIAIATKEDAVLQEISGYIQKGRTWIPKTSSDKVRRFSKIMDQLTMTAEPGKLCTSLQPTVAVSA